MVVLNKLGLVYLLGEAAAIVDCLCHEGFAWAIAVFSWLVCITVIFPLVQWPGFSVSGFNVVVDEFKRGHHLCGGLLLRIAQ